MSWKISIFKCPKCNFVNDFLKAKRECEDADISYFTSLVDLAHDEDGAGLGEFCKSTLCDVITVLDKYVRLPYESYYGSQTELSLCLKSIGNFTGIRKVR